MRRCGEHRAAAKATNEAAKETATGDSLNVGVKLTSYIAEVGMRKVSQGEIVNRMVYKIC